MQAAGDPLVGIGEVLMGGQMHLEPLFLGIVKLVVHIVPLTPVAPDMNALGALLTHGDMKVPPRLRRMVSIDRIRPKRHTQRHPTALFCTVIDRIKALIYNLSISHAEMLTTPFRFDKVQAPLYTTAPIF
jgi:hypothetical protein